MLLMDHRFHIMYLAVENSVSAYVSTDNFSSPIPVSDWFPVDTRRRFNVYTTSIQRR